MEMLQRKLAESEVKRAEAVQQLKSLSVSEIYDITARHLLLCGRVDTIQPVERATLQLDAGRDRINYYFREDH